MNAKFSFIFVCLVFYGLITNYLIDYYLIHRSNSENFLDEEKKNRQIELRFCFQMRKFDWIFRNLKNSNEKLKEKENLIEFQNVNYFFGYITAFFDFRLNSVVVLGQLASRNKTREYFCDLKFSNFSLTVPLEFQTTYMYYCNYSMTKIHFIPNSVALRHCKTKFAQKKFIPIRRIPKKDPSVGSFAVCGPTVMNNYSNWELVLQFIEIYRILGAENFLFYFHDSTPEVERILKFYSESGIIQLIRWLPSPFCTFRFNYYCQRLRMNECVLRTMNRYEFVAFVDLDEILYPNPVGKFKTIPALLNSLQTEETGSFHFHTCWLQRMEDPASLQSRNVRRIMPFLYAVNRSDAAPWGDSSKAILIPHRVRQTWIHYVRLHLPGYKMTDVPPELGLNRHYKPLKRGLIGRSSYKWHMDPPRIEHQTALIAAVSRSLKQIFQ